MPYEFTDWKLKQIKDDLLRAFANGQLTQEEFEKRLEQLGIEQIKEDWYAY